MSLVEPAGCLSCPGTPNTACTCLTIQAIPLQHLGCLNHATQPSVARTHRHAARPGFTRPGGHTFPQHPLNCSPLSLITPFPLHTQSCLSTTAQHHSARPPQHIPCTVLYCLQPCCVRLPLLEQELHHFPERRAAAGSQLGKARPLLSEHGLTPLLPWGPSRGSLPPRARPWRGLARQGRGCPSRWRSGTHGIPNTLT